MKHRFSLLILLLILAAATPAAAQNLHLKLGGGLASRYGSDKAVGAYKIGMGYEVEFDQHWTLTPQLLFYGKGWQDPERAVPVINDDGTPMLDDNGQQAYSTMSRSTAACYVELPLMLSYYIRVGEARYIVLSAGPYTALGVNGKIKTRGDGSRIGSEKLFYSSPTFGHEGLRRFDAGIQSFAGYQFGSGLILGMEADWGLVKTRRNGKRNLSGLISLSYKF